MSADTSIYCFHQVLALPREWAQVGQQAAPIRRTLGQVGGELYGAWRSQIGRPRDEVTIVTRWPHGPAPGSEACEQALRSALPPIRRINSVRMRPALRPTDGMPPARQGNYAFRFFELPAVNREEFLALCAAAWPGFESAYDSQVIGLWDIDCTQAGRARALLLTRRPDLAMWERSKLPQGADEAQVRDTLSRRYDLCDDTEVYTTTLLTATDQADRARWT